MQVGEFVERFRREFAVAAQAGGEAVQDAAERLIVPLDSAIRLMLLEALAAAADEITRDLAPGSVHLRLRGRDADFVVTMPPADVEPGRAEPAPVPDADGPVARVNFRPPESLKARIEEAASKEGLSVNTWLVRAANAALDPAPAAARPPRRGAWFA